MKTNASHAMHSAVNQWAGDIKISAAHQPGGPTVKRGCTAMQSNAISRSPLKSPEPHPLSPLYYLLVSTTFLWLRRYGTRLQMSPETSLTSLFERFQENKGRSLVHAARLWYRLSHVWYMYYRVQKRIEATDLIASRCSPSISIPLPPV